MLFGIMSILLRGWYLVRPEILTSWFTQFQLERLFRNWYEIASARSCSFEEGLSNSNRPLIYADDGGVGVS